MYIYIYIFFFRRPATYLCHVVSLHQQSGRVRHDPHPFHFHEFRPKSLTDSQEIGLDSSFHPKTQTRLIFPCYEGHSTPTSTFNSSGSALSFTFKSSVSTLSITLNVVYKIQNIEIIIYHVGHSMYSIEYRYNTKSQYRIQNVEYSKQYTTENREYKMQNVEFRI